MREPPIVREWRLINALPQVVLLALLIMIGMTLAGGRSGLLPAVLLYLAYSFGSRELITRDQRRGIRLYQREQWAEALACFQRSQVFFEKHPWLDRYRHIVLTSASTASYHELALLNQAACQIQLHRGAEAKQLYERVLQLYPDSPLAKSTLAVLALGKNLTDGPNQ